MSSSHQKNQLADFNHVNVNKGLLPCPECNQMTMEYIQSDCTLKDGTFIPNLGFYYCSSCKLKFFDDTAMEIIESVRIKRNQNH